MTWERTRHVEKKRKEQKNKGASQAEPVRGKALRVEVGEVGRGQVMQHFVDPRKGDANQTLTRPRMSDTRRGMKKLSRKEWRRMPQW